MFEDPIDRNRIEDVKKTLYSRNFKPKEKQRYELEETETNINTDWKDDDKIVPGKELPLTKILLGALIFFVLASGFAVYRFWGGSNIVSGDNIEITLKGPVSVAGGEVLPLEVDIRNNNSVPLKVVDLQITFPDGSRDAENISKELKRYTEILGDMEVGATKTKLIKAVLFGEENSRKNINVSVEYRVAGSNAIFSKEKDFPILISSSPVNIIVKGITEANSNQNIDYEIEVVSNSVSTMKDLSLRVDYPFGFEYKSSTPKPYLDNNIWNIGDLAPGDKRTIKLSGNITGQDGEERVFKFTVGNPSSFNEREIETPFIYTASSIFIRKPFVALSLAIDGSLNKEIVVEGGRTVRGDLVWTNNLPNQIYDISVELKFRGDILDKNSVSSQKGFYRSIDNTIIFSSENNSSLLSLSPGQSGEASFDFSSFSSISRTGSAFINPEIYIDVLVKGKRIQGLSVPEELLFSDSKHIKVSSDISLLSRGFYYIGPFSNTGPIPPIAESETTYTVTWTITNTSNTVTGTKVSATIPSYVKWNNLFIPGTEKISFNPLGGEIVWDVGEVKAGAGNTLPIREVSFQISFTPSLSQVGTSPMLLSDARVTGTDSFTKTEIGETKVLINTDLKFDPNFPSEGGKVVR